MFIIRNKETKKFPTEYSGELEFPLSAGQELSNALAGFYVSNQEGYLDKYLKTDYDSEHYEIIEFKWCDPFYIREAVDNRNFEINGYGKVEFNTNAGMEYLYDEDGNCIYATNGVAIEIPSYQKHFILTLYQGSAYIHYWARHEEGSSYEEFNIELVRDEDGFPYWAIESNSGGTDCDGPIEYHRFCISHGGFRAYKENPDFNQEKYDCEIKWNSPMLEDPNRKGWNRDLYAEQAGY